jgi:hypothetical protein
VEIRHHFIYLIPKRIRVIPVMNMAEFVDSDVVDDFWLCQQNRKATLMNQQYS